MQANAHATPSSGDTRDLRVDGHLKPATFEVQTGLSEDTIQVSAFDVAAGPQQVALFANPYADGQEEMLYINPQGRLGWARHSNQGADGAAGWTTQWISDHVDRVVVVVHPQGRIWCFALSVDVGRVGVFTLVDDGILGPQWLPEPGLVDMAAAQFGVQYLNDRQSTALVWFVDASGRLLVLQPLFGMGITEGTWHTLVRSQLDPRDVLTGRRIAVGADGDHLQTVRVYTSTVDAVPVVYEIGAGDGHARRFVVNAMITDVIGGLSHPDIAGCVVLGRDVQGPGQFIGMFGARPGDDWHQVLHTWVRLDQPLEDHVSWQDRDGRVHLYGRAANGGLHVVHQTGWFRSEDSGFLVPTWDEHSVGGQSVASTHALVGGVRSFALDAFPDDMPEQHVMLSGATGEERCAIYTQSIDGRYWAEEKMRMVGTPASETTAVTRYQVVATVLDGYGSPRPDIEVSINADDPVDLDIRGSLYRVGPLHAARVRSDRSGRIVLKVAPSGLAMPRLHLSAVGVEGSVTVNPAAAVHKFLGGGGGLPNHPQGFTAATVRDARNPDGGWLFPDLVRTDRSDVLPTADDVVAWCALTLSAEARDLGTGTGSACAVAFQVHDRTRPALAVHEGADARDAAWARLREGATVVGGDRADRYGWSGDIWQGIRSGLVQVQEVIVDLERALTGVMVTLADGARLLFTAAWDRLKGAAQAVESVFVAVGARVEQVVAWLRWAIDFKDVWDTAVALESCFRQLPARMKEATALARQAGTAWAGDARERLPAVFATWKQAFGHQTMGQFSAPGLGPGMEAPAPALGMRDMMSCAHAGWFNERLMVSMETLARLERDRAAPPPVPQADNPLIGLIDSVKALPQWQAFTPIWAQARDDFAAVLDVNDPQAALSTGLVAMLNVFENVAAASVSLAEGAFQAFMDFIDAALDLLIGLFDTPLTDIPLLPGLYGYIQTRAGVPQDQQRPLTIGRAGMMLGAYPVTVFLKALWGRAPFPGGTFDLDQLFTPPARAVPGQGPGGVIRPEKWVFYATVQSMCSAMMVPDAGFDNVLNFQALQSEATRLNLPPAYWRVWACLHVLAYGVGNLPTLWGNTFPPRSMLEADSLPTWNWICSILANGIDAMCALGWGTFVTEFDEDHVGVGAGVFFALGLARMCIAGARHENAADKDYPSGALNLSISVLAFVSPTTGFVRRIYREKPGPYTAGAVVVKNVLDTLCDTFAGVASVWEVGYEDNHPPRIVWGLTPFSGREGTPLTHDFRGTAGFEPYTWSVIPVEMPRPGTKSGLPPGLGMDPDTGRISGVPTAMGVYEFHVALADDYGPAFVYRSDEPLVVTIE